MKLVKAIIYHLNIIDLKFINQTTKENTQITTLKSLLVTMYKEILVEIRKEFELLLAIANQDILKNRKAKMMQSLSAMMEI